MRHRLDPESPVPLYHQIAEALRWSISTGQLVAGDRLPAVREAAPAFGVNRHTVRRAYGELAKEGWVEIRGARGTRVLGGQRSPARRPPEDEERFLERIAGEARERYGWTVEDLRGRLAAHADSDRPVVFSVECSDSQCRDHAAEISRRWQVDARPWNLNQSGEPPPGTIVATFFHYPEIQRRWRHRWHEIHFLPIQVDASLPARLAEAVAASGGRLVACEMDEAKALNVKGDLSVLFPEERYSIEVKVTKRAGEALTGDAPICFAPRVWDALSSREAADPRAFKVLYLIEPKALEDLGRRLGWLSVR